MLFLYKNWPLIYQLSVREIATRYRGSALGIIWSLVNPLLMLTVYTFVFSVVLKVKWGLDTDTTQSHFSIVLFSGLILYTLFAEAINSAPSIVLQHPNFVKKVVFPLEILPVVRLVNGLFHAMISISVLLVAILVYSRAIPWTVIFFPLILAPLSFLILGLGWLLASTGVYLRDIGQLIGLITTLLLFLSPVFFPASAIPEKFQALFYLNPLTLVIEEFRAIMIWGKLPNFRGLAIYTGATLITSWIGFCCFQKTKKGFADVL